MRLFTALWLPDDAAAALALHVPAVAPAGWRLMDPPTWHVTLAFHGDADPALEARRLERSVRDAAAPRLRLAGAGAFDGVRWVGVETSGGRLRALVAAVGGDAGRFVAHVSVLRERARPGPSGVAHPEVSWSGHAGPSWVPAEVLLVASEPGRGGPRYRVVHRAPLAGRETCRLG